MSLKQISIYATVIIVFTTTTFAQDPEVTNVEARQLDFPSLMVEVTYDVEADSEAVWITLRISDDDGETWDVPVRSVEGDVGEGVEIGEGKRIFWDAGEDFPDQNIEEMKVRIIADDLLDEPEAGTERDFELIEDVWITMVWIPRGSFMMGALDGERDAENDERPRHRVTFDYGFWMGKYEVTQAQWETVTGNNPGEDRYGDRWGIGDDHPVYEVSWDDIQGFEERLEEVFRLPSEAEWEYACRAGHDDVRFWWGDDNNYEELGDYAWYNDNSDNQTHNVGEKEPNPWGLYDILGNVWEWCEDWSHDNYNDAPDDGSPWVAGGGEYGVLRGGGWAQNASFCRSAERYIGRFHRGRDFYIGFRLVLDQREEEE